MKDDDLRSKILLLEENNKIIEEQYESLLLNILPFEIARQLKLKGRVKPKKYNSVTILFLDFVSFTKNSEILEPGKLIDILDLYFKAFDKIIDKYKVEKIKTIGDAYMCVGGLPVPNENHALNTVCAAIEMLNFVNDRKFDVNNSLIAWDCTIGIHSGPVVAGIIGTKKYSYDVWGSSVNIAARMQQESEKGKINISGTTYNIVKNNFEFIYRGIIPIKNGKEQEMYFLNV